MKKYLQRSIQGSLGAVSSTNTYVSSWQFVDSFERCMIQVVWTGTPVANVSVLISADPIPSIENYSSAAAAAPVNYDIATSTTTSTSGKTILTYEITGTAANWIALQWVNVSGTGTIQSVNFVGKGSLV
jgi:DMSO/TMAO reductase YedYZ molybdopterin-dependent catalytic subunit